MRTPPSEIVTDRLRLRCWADRDLPALAALNRDPRNLAYLPGPLTEEQTAVMMTRFRDHRTTHGFGPWALERRDNGLLVGFIGLLWTSFSAFFTPSVEIGWRIGADHTRQGFATEAARALLDQEARDRLGLAEVVAFTVPANLPSRRVMDKLGMTHDPEETFDHPLLAPGHSLRPHVLYRARLG